ncbi:hypothetical protein [Ktedonobacter robiniae]|nr:hypothetical protein [Ktedonobacter robiniae]
MNRVTSLLLLALVDLAARRSFCKWLWQEYTPFRWYQHCIRRIR